MNIETLRGYIVEQIKMYEQIADADHRLAVCREARGRLAARLKKSAQKTFDNDSIKQRMDKDPEFKKLMEASKKYRRYVNAKRITQRIEDEYRKIHNTEA